MGMVGHTLTNCKRQKNPLKDSFRGHFLYLKSILFLFYIFIISYQDIKVNSILWLKLAKILLKIIFSEILNTKFIHRYNSLSTDIIKFRDFSRKIKVLFHH